MATTTGTCSRCLKSWFGTMTSMLEENHVLVADAIPVILRNLSRKLSSAWLLIRLWLTQKLMPEVNVRTRMMAPRIFADNFRFVNTVVLRDFISDLLPHPWLSNLSGP